MGRKLSQRTGVRRAVRRRGGGKYVIIQKGKWS